MLDIRKYLVHRCDILTYITTPATLDGWGTASHYTGTPTQNVDCFVYFGSDEFNLDTLVGIPRMVYSAPTKWQIVLPKQYVQLVSVKDKIINVVEKATGSSVRQEGYINEFKIYRHHRHGAMFALGVLGDGDGA